MNQIGLLGDGGQADEVESYLDEGIEVVFRAVSKQYLESSTSSNLVDLDNPDSKRDSKVIAATGAPGLRKSMVETWPGKEYATCVSRQSVVAKPTSLGKGTVVAPGAVVTTNVKIGQHVIINIGATVSHNCNIGDFVTISPGAHIAGNSHIGDGVFIGIGAIISNRVKIAAGSVIGAGAVVLDDVTVENSVVVGAPAKVIKTNKDWLSEI